MVVTSPVPPFWRGFKLDQLLIEPFQSFHSALVRHVYAADAILIAGYGFGDIHINRALRYRFAGHAARPRALVIDYGEIRPLAWRADPWADDLCTTLRTNAHAFSVSNEPSSEPLTSESYAVFDVNEAQGIAVWQNGFREALPHADRIIGWLHGKAHPL